MMPDVTVRNEGSIVLFSLDTPAAQAWWDANVSECMTFGKAYVVEHRYAPDIITGMDIDRLEVEVQR